MNRYILKRKREIMTLSGVLIVFAMISHFVFNHEVEVIAFLVGASVIGIVPIVIQAYQALKVKVISIELLVSIAVLGAFLIGNYEESAVVSFLFLFGSYLEQRTIMKTRLAIKALTDLAPEKANVLRDNHWTEVPLDEVFVNDIVQVKTGERVPVDGIITQGEAAVDESSITGESLPVLKTLNSHVYSGTLVDNGTLQVRTQEIGEDTMFGKIIELVEEAQDSKSETERFIDKFAKYYTPVVLMLSILVYMITKNIETAITLLVLGCPGALVIGVPVSNVSGIGNGAKYGVLLKGSEVISKFKDVDTFVFDKTGTLTSGKPKVSKHISYDQDDKHSLKLLASVEKQSNHPLAQAVLTHLDINEYYKVEDTKVYKGTGIKALVDRQDVLVGNLNLMIEHDVEIKDKVFSDLRQLEQEGHSIVLFASNRQIKILLGVKDELREGVSQTLLTLKRQGVKQLIILSGDNQGTVDHVSESLSIDKALGNMLPIDKSNYIKDLQKQGHHVAFVGDGINDSPSLAIADVGIAMGNGTDVAIETSDVVLMNSNLKRLPHAYGLSKATASNMLQNIMIAIGVVIILMYGLLFKDWMSMTLGMFVHEGSILVVIINAMRLLNYKVRT